MNSDDHVQAKHLAEQIRKALVEAALHAYEDAGIQGLCAEGRWEAAVGALQSLDLSLLLGELRKAPPAGSVPPQMPGEGR